MALPALGEEISENPPPLESPPEELVVSADRRNSTPFDVPLSVDVLSDVDLIRSSTLTSFDLPKLIPSLVMSRNSVLVQPYIRGVGSDLITAAGDSSVITLVDGVVRSRVLASEIEFFDVDRVEVVKGPQSTLYGRNATGGVIHVVTENPAPNYESALRVSGGSFEALRLEGMMNVPLVDEVLALRVAGVRNRRNGWTRVVGPSGSVDDQDLWSGRGKLLWTPAETTSVLFSADYQREDSTRGSGNKVTSPFAGSPAAGSGGNVPRNPRRIDVDRRPEVEIEVWGTSLDLEQEFRLLDLDWDFTSATSYRESDAELDLDLDGTQLDFVSNTAKEDSQTWTQELRIASESLERVDFFGGLYFLHEAADQSFRVRTPPIGVDDRTDAKVRNVAAAVFAEAKIKIVENVFFTAGLRYSWERREIDFEEVFNGALVAAFKDQDDWQSVDPRFVLEWQRDDRYRGYFSINRGYKAGGYNTVIAQTESFDQESLWSYELGGRAALFDRRLQLSAAVFYYDYDDIQLNVLSPTSLTPFPEVRNAGRAAIWGAEIGTTIEPYDGFRLEFNLSALHTEFDGLVAVDPNNQTGDPDQSGNRLPRAPTVAFFAAAQYSWDFSSIKVTPRVEYSHQSKVYFSVYQDSTVAESSYGLVNARLDFEVPGLKSRVGFFGRNLTDQLYAHSRLRLDGQLGNIANWGEPRVFGVDASFEF